MEIDRVKIKNFKSIRDLVLDFRQINIMIGGNGVGKSNFISYFRLLNEIINLNLSGYIIKNSGANSFLYFGRKVSSNISSKIYFRNGSYKNLYSFELHPTPEDNFYIANEAIGFDRGSGNWTLTTFSKARKETGIFVHDKNEYNTFGGRTSISTYVISAFRSFKIYHFHDTSESAKVKQTVNINDNEYLREDASNLAPFLYKLKNESIINYNQIESTIRRIAPFFERFDLKPSALNPETIRLEWKEKGSDEYFNAHSLSDGTLRMICLCTLLLQPSPPNTIIIDEPELGLHPKAIYLLASIIKSISSKCQIIVSTQSVTLVNQFTPDDLIIVDRSDNQSVFRRINEQELAAWQEEYSLGDIWEKNLIGGRP